MLKPLALALALTGAQALPAAAQASPLPSYPFVHVSADAMRHTRPNIGALDFVIVAPDADPAQARATVESRIAEVRALLAEQGIALEDLETRDARRRADIIAEGAKRKLGAVMAVTPGGVKNVGAAIGLVRADFSYTRVKASNVEARNFLSVDALKLAQPVDVVFKLE